MRDYVKGKGWVGMKDGKPVNAITGDIQQVPQNESQQRRGTAQTMLDSAVDQSGPQTGQIMRTNFTPFIAVLTSFAVALVLGGMVWAFAIGVVVTILLASGKIWRDRR